MNSQESRQYFAELASLPDREIDLTRAALMYALDEYTDLDIERYLRRLEMMRYVVGERVVEPHEPMEVIHALNAYLFDERGFRGNREDYYDPSNSYLNEVMDRRLGIPITLSVIYLDVAQGLGVPVVGIGMPGHFLVKYEGEDTELFIDPFDEGRLMTEGECVERFNEITGRQSAFDPRFLRPVKKKQILTRMLANLRGAYVMRQDFPRALRFVDKMLLLNPLDSEIIRDAGLLHAQLGDFHHALEYLDLYLRIEPDTPDTRALRERIVAIKELLEGMR